MAAQGTPPTQIRLTDEDLVRVAAIREHWGLPSSAAAIRYAIGREYARLTSEEKILKKSRKGD